MEGDKASFSPSEPRLNSPYTDKESDRFGRFILALCPAQGGGRAAQGGVSGGVFGLCGASLFPEDKGVEGEAAPSFHFAAVTAVNSPGGRLLCFTELPWIQR